MPFANSPKGAELPSFVLLPYRFDNGLYDRWSA